MAKARAFEVHGTVAPGWQAVREAFVGNFEARGEVGAACCVYHRSEKVVDLWGGVRERETESPWQADTWVPVFSLTKGMSSMAMALAHSRGWLDFDERVASYWPEFSQNGKERITVRQLLAHLAGLSALDEPITLGIIANFERLDVILAGQKPAHAPGAREAFTAGASPGTRARCCNAWTRSGGGWVGSSARRSRSRWERTSISACRMRCPTRRWRD